MIVDSTSNVLTLSTPEVIKVTAQVEDAPTFVNEPDPTRINQQKFLPNSVNSRLIGDLLSNNPTSSALGSGTYANGTVAASSSLNFLFTLADNQGREVIGIPDIAFYIVDSTGVFNHWPNLTYGMGNMPVAVFNDWGNTNNTNTVTRAIIRNNTSFDQLVYCVCRYRIITFPNSVSTNSPQTAGGSTSTILPPAGSGGGPH